MPTARLDGPHADLPSSSSSTPYGLPAARVPNLAPKSAGSASLMPLRRAASWEDEDRVTKEGDKDGRRVEMTPRTEERGAFDDPLRSNWGASTSDIDSVPPLSPDVNPFRRGSAVSASSALSSDSPHASFLRPSGSSMYMSRHSISSLGGYTINTVGDASNASASFPLLGKQVTRESSAASAHIGQQNSRSPSREGEGSWERPRARSGGGGRRPSSACSFSPNSETSSIHSYPPLPRQRTRSTMGSSGNAEGWASFATGQIKRERTRESQDAWPAVVSTSYIRPPLARPPQAYQSSLSTYSFPGPSTRAPHLHHSLPVAINPLNPLRKRLARSLASSGTGGSTLNPEAQLLLELIDALEHCITSFSPSNGTSGDLHRSSGEPGASSTLPTSPSSSSSPGALPCPLNHATSTTPAPRSEASRSTLVDEVRLLIRELVELVPDAQACLIAGSYGPLSARGAGTSTKALLRSLEEASENERRDERWWPPKLARDCRALLEETGLLTVGLVGGATWSGAAAGLGEGSEGAGKPPTAASSPGVGGEEQDSGGNMSDERRQELLQQGKMRWAAYRAEQAAREKCEASPTPF
ncbi:hypothetical protein JCM10213_006933 [Rhodosporidiobolus nylandii]